MRSAVRRAEGLGGLGETARAVDRRGMGSGGRVARLSSGVQERGRVARPRFWAKGGTGGVCRERRGTALPSPARRGCPSGVDWSNRCAPAPPLPSWPRRGAGRRAGGAAVGRACDWPAWTGPGGQGRPGAGAPGRRRRRGACRSALLPGPPPAWPAALRSGWLELRKLSGRVATPRTHHLVTLALGWLGSLWDGSAQRPRWRVEVRARSPESS